MERNNLGLMLLVLGVTGTFVMQFVRVPQPATTVVASDSAQEKKGGASSTTSSSELGASKSVSSSRPTFTAPLAGFLATPIPNNPSEAMPDIENALKSRLEAEVGDLDFLIYLVADPLEAQANYRFDQQIDVLHKALAVERFVPDRFYLPWTRGDKQRTHTREPGVILFRRNGPSQSTKQKVTNTEDAAFGYTDLVLVFLVGETATTGIHTEAFERAVEHQQWLRKLYPGNSGISVCGPSFSGSADSLARTIGRLKEKAKQNAVQQQTEQAAGNESQGLEFNVITGQAISIHRKRFRTLSKNTEIFATVLHGNILKEALIQHVTQRNSRWNRERIAWLTETGTGYGAAISFLSRDHEQRSQRNHDSRNPGSDQIGHTEPSENGPEVIEFPFPANIAQVRAAYEESLRRDSKNKAKESLGGLPLRLTIPFKAGDGSTEMVPSHTPDVSTPTAEIILGQILTTIRNQGIMYVGISATDPRDPLFIAAMIKDQCPNVQIMLVTSDVLHVHPEYTRIMHGALVASTYPLYPEALTWCFPYGEHTKPQSLQGEVKTQTPGPQMRILASSRNTVLSSQNGYGTYNALVLLRGMQTKRYQAEQGKSVVRLLPEPSGTSGDMRRNYFGLPLCYGTPFQQGESDFRPSVWVSRIGNSSFHPITSKPVESYIGKDSPAPWLTEYTLTLKVDAATLEKFPQHVHTEMPLPLRLLVVAWLAAGVITALILLKHSLLFVPWQGRRTPEWFAKLELGKWARPLTVSRTTPSALRGLQLVLRALGTLCFVVILTLLGSIQLASLKWSGFDWASVALGFCVLLALLFGGVLISELLDACRRDSRWPMRLFTSGGATVLSVLLLVLTVLQLPHGVDWTSIACFLCLLMAGLLTLLLVVDLVDAFVGGERNEPGSTNLGKRLMGARIGGAVLTTALLIGFGVAAGWQLASWKEPIDAYLWYCAAANIGNGLSFLTTVQLPCLAVLVLAYGMIVQLHCLSEKNAICLPTQIVPKNQIEKKEVELRDSLLFPVLSRFRREKPVVLSLLIILAVAWWLVYMWSGTQGPDFFATSINFPCILWLLAALFWFLRFFKLMHILQDFCDQLKEYAGRIRSRWPDWGTMFKDAGVQKNGLEDLLWRKYPYDKRADEEIVDREGAANSSLIVNLMKIETQRRNLCAREVEIFVRRMFYHFGRLMVGLIVAGCLMFLAAQGFPLSSEPLMRSTASAMLAASGLLIVWFYIKFDRDELLSYLVGTDPKKVAWNWSMIQNVAPGLTLATIALVSQAFPEVWLWLRHVIEPLSLTAM
jgi:hypothetical protein